MSRTLSLTTRRAMNAQETGEIVIFLMTVTHPDLDGPIRLSSDPTTRLSDSPLTYGTASRGQSFLFVPFGLILPDEKEAATPQAKVMLDNVDREMVNILRSTSTPAQVKIELVLASEPDVVEVEEPMFDLVSADYDAQTVTLTLVMNGLATEPFPSGSFNPSSFPGLF